MDVRLIGGHSPEPLETSSVDEGEFRRGSLLPLERRRGGASSAARAAGRHPLSRCATSLEEFCRREEHFRAPLIEPEALDLLLGFDYPRQRARVAESGRRSHLPRRGRKVDVRLSYGACSADAGGRKRRSPLRSRRRSNSLHITAKSSASTGGNKSGRRQESSASIAGPCRGRASEGPHADRMRQTAASKRHFVACPSRNNPAYSSGF